MVYIGHITQILLNKLQGVVFVCAFVLLLFIMFPLQDSGFLDGAFESQNAALVSLSHLLYDELVKSILRIVEKLDLSVQKVTTGEEVRCRVL